MTGKEAFEDYKQLYVAKEFKDGDCRIQKMYEEIINDKFDELTKYKKVFEILKEVLVIPEDDDIDWYDNNTDYYRLTTKRLINMNERDLLEELMKSERL